MKNKTYTHFLEMKIYGVNESVRRDFQEDLFKIKADLKLKAEKLGIPEENIVINVGLNLEED